MEAGTGVMHLQAKEWQEVPKAGRGKDQGVLKALRRDGALPTS